MARLTIASSRWGNLYRHRYYIDGKRVSNDAFEAVYAQEGHPLGTFRGTSYGYRRDWDI